MVYVVNLTNPKVGICTRQLRSGFFWPMAPSGTWPSWVSGSFSSPTLQPSFQIPRTALVLSVLYKSSQIYPTFWHSEIQHSHIVYSKFFLISRPPNLLLYHIIFYFSNLTSLGQQTSRSSSIHNHSSASFAHSVKKNKDWYVWVKRAIVVLLTLFSTHVIKNHPLCTLEAKCTIMR